MVISGEQIWNNLFLILVIALVIEMSLTGLFSIKYMASMQDFKNVIVIVVAFGLCANIPQLRILYKSRISIPDLIHMVMTALILTSIVNLVHNWLAPIRAKGGL